MKKTAFLLTFLSCLLALDIHQGQAQEIIPADDGTATIVMPNGDRIDIDGGTLSKDGKNLFHSFQEFGLNADQIANFLSNPQIVNILGRINGGNPSVINGLIQVSGGNSNLYLMNPAGIIFGPNASLNVPGDFTATSATSIEFGEGVFNAFGPNNYANLVGNPTAFIFATDKPGVIINRGDLEVTGESNLALIGGTVINTGTISTPEGNITITAVPGTSKVIIRQEGHILGLEIELPEDSNGNTIPIEATDLPTLLTEGVAGLDTGLTVAENREVRLNNTNFIIPNQPGTTIISGTIKAENLETGGIGGQIQILGTRLGIVDATINASGLNGGGNIYIGGEYKGEGTLPTAERTVVNSGSVIRADALSSGDGGNIIVWADQVTAFSGEISARGGEISGDGGFAEVSGKESLIFRGSVDLGAPNGNGGSLLLDPENITIVSGDEAPDDGQLSDGQILAGDGGDSDFTISEEALEGSTAFEITIEATNDITMESLEDGELTLRRNTTFTADADGDGTGSFSMDPTDTIRVEGERTENSLTISGASVTTGNIEISSNSFYNFEAETFPQGNVTITATNGSVETGNIITQGNEVDGYSNLLGNAGNITITATDNITTGDLTTQGGNIIGVASSSDFPYISNLSNGGDIEITGNNITTGNLTTQGGNIEESVSIDSSVISINNVSTGGDITITGNNITTDNLTTQGGNIEASSSSEPSIISINNLGDSGDIEITGNNIDAGNIISEGGNLANSEINLRINDEDEIDSQISLGDAGEIEITADDSLTTGNIISEAGDITDSTISSEVINLGDGANIEITAENSIETGNIRSQGGSVENVTIDALEASLTAGDGGRISINGGFDDNITIPANTLEIGNLNVSGGEITSTNAGNMTGGNAGNIELTADSVITGSIQANGGDVEAPSEQINVDYDNSDITVNGTFIAGNAGNLEISATNNISTEIVTSDGGNIVYPIDVIDDEGFTITPQTPGNAGNINISLIEGTITLNPSISSQEGGYIFETERFSVEGVTGGNLTITITEGGSIETPININGDIFIDGDDFREDVDSNFALNTNKNVNFSGDINIPGLTEISGSGDVVIEGNSLQFGDINASVDDLTLNALQDSIVTGNINTSNGNLYLNASYNIETGYIYSSYLGLNAGSNIQTGNIDISGGYLYSLNITTENIDTSSNLNLNAFSIITGNIDIVGGGDVDIQGSFVDLGEFNVSSDPTTINQISINGSEQIIIDSINAPNRTLNITTSGTLQVVEVFSVDDDSVSILANTVTITHGGNIDENPFIVGNSEVNGTAGAIVSTNEVVDPEFEAPNDFLSDEGTIQIIGPDIPIDFIVAEDGSTTLVRSRDGVTVNIEEGTLSGDGDNLFHSFERFDLPESEQVANFVLDSDSDSDNIVQNIFARVVSGDASDIHGTIQIDNEGFTGNLFILNPAGIVISDTAQINVPGDLTLTTANGIGFGDNWFSASGDFNANVLNGNPQTLAFTMSEPGAIINSANLDIDGQLQLAAGTVVSTGELSSTQDLKITATVGEVILDLETLAITPIDESPTLPTDWDNSILSLEGLVNEAGDEANLGVSVLDTNTLEISTEEKVVEIEPQDVPVSDAVTTESGEIIITATQDIFTTGDISTEPLEEGNGGDITLESTNGNIDTTSFNISTNSNTGNGGNIEITAENGDISTSNIFSGSINGNAGNITISSPQGNIDTSEGFLAAGSISGNGGQVTIEAQENINADTIATTAQANGGNITISSESGTIILTDEISYSYPPESLEPFITITGLDSRSLTQGDAGSINITGDGDISTSNISSSSNQGNGGSITLESTNGNIDTTSGVIAATANNGDGGQIQINAQGNIQAGNIDSSSLTQGDAGNINITSEENITTTQITSSSEQGNGGNITINSGQGNINTTDILATSSENGGNINLTAENGAVNTSNLSSTSENGNAGNISITGNNGVNTNEINSSSDNEDAGNVTITSTSDIQISNINAEARDSGTGGQVNLTTDGFVQIDETFTNQNGDPASISTIGGNPGDEIIIDHGGEGETPFIVGDPEINGTAGSLYSSETSITPDRFFLFTENRDNIAIISVDSPQITDPGDFKNQPVTPIEQVTILPPAVQINTITEVQQILLNIGEKTGEKPALIYVRFIAPELTDKSAFDDNDLAEVEAKRTAEIDPAALPTISIPDQEKSQLQIILITPEQETVVVTVPEATFNDVIPTVEKFYEYIDEQRPEFLYLPEGQKLYQWLIAGIEPELEAREITNMLFFLPPQMRQLPIAAIHDQQTNQYLVQKYSLGLAPSFNLLVNTSYRSIKNEPALAFGTSEFTDFNPLPGVKVIIDQIEETRPVQAFVESEFTKNNLEIKYESNPYPIIFLGTHADFRPDQVEKQFVLLHDDEKLKIQDLQQFDWRNQPVELLILAACRTAIGNLESELGFSGVAFKAGVKTTLGSLWYVPDTSTSALMTEFFYQLNTVPIKAEALQQAQIAMLQGDVTVQLNQNNQIEITLPSDTIVIPSEINLQVINDLTHPKFWSGFTLIGSPW